MNDPLADLKDIHLPADLGWWPPAYGWWLLAIVLLSLVVYLCVYSLKRHRFNLARREALHSLSMITPQTHNWPLACNSLLKRLVQTYRPELAAQSLYGQSWLELLTEFLPAAQQAGFKPKMQAFQQTLYQAQPSAQLDFAEYQALFSGWIKNARLTAKNSQQQLPHQAEQYAAPGANNV